MRDMGCFQGGGGQDVMRQGACRVEYDRDAANPAAPTAYAQTQSRPYHPHLRFGKEYRE
jgi:hypothetical protein